MNMAANRLGIGGNLPPSEIEILQERLAGYTAEYAELERLSGKEIPAVITDEKQAGDITDYLKAIATLNKRITEAHKKEKQPFLECGRIADGWKKNYETSLEELKRKASVPLNAFLAKKAEEERQRQLELAKKQREEAEKLAKEAEAHAAEGINDTADELMNAAIQSEQSANMIQEHAVHARPSELTKARSVTGASASQKMVWTGDIESIHAVDLEALRPYFAEDSVQKAINAAIRDGVREIRGVNIYQKAQISVR